MPKIIEKSFANFSHFFVEIFDFHSILGISIYRTIIVKKSFQKKNIKKVIKFSFYFKISKNVRGRVGPAII